MSDQHPGTPQAGAPQAEITAAIKYYRDVEHKVAMCMAGPDALDDARAKLAQLGDPAVLLAR